LYGITGGFVRIYMDTNGCSENETTDCGTLYGIKGWFLGISINTKRFLIETNN
jgi:hypothetical protein